jgi:hypothetical protein
MRGIKSSIQMHSHSFDALNDAKLLQFLALKLIFLVFFCSSQTFFYLAILLPVFQYIIKPPKLLVDTCIN